MWIAGADGCKTGWVVVLRDLESGALRVRVAGRARALLRLAEAPAVVGVDLPIGLPAAAERGGRECDRAARQLLGRVRSSSVFSAPVRATLQASTYEAALRLSRASSPAGIGLSKQSYYLLDKIRALDALLTPARQTFVREVHPEVSFAALNGGEALAASKKTEAGRAQRRALLAEAGLAPLPAPPPPGAAPDDLLDAAAVCWTASRIARGEAQRLPADATRPQADDRGLRMEIWW